MGEDGPYCLGGGRQAPGPAPMGDLFSVSLSRTGFSTCFLLAWFQGLKYTALKSEEIFKYVLKEWG